MEPVESNFPEQDQDGVDLSIIRRNLRLSPTERLRRADAAAREYEALMKKLSPATQIIFERLKREW
jgi:hypothetical protein